MLTIEDVKAWLDVARDEFNYQESFAVKEELWSYQTGVEEIQYAVSVFHPKVFGEELEIFRGNSLEDVFKQVQDWFAHWQLMRTAN